ncbi:MAG: hypothetical protein J7K78_04185 [Thaumarchaeota archaeon]|nr:hypothetical protein [Nitrososphaerota archaeon]
MCYSTQYCGRMTAPTHSQCVYFRNGICVLRGIQVPPEAPACPSFTPRSTPPTYPQPQPWPPTLPQPISPLRLMRRIRRRFMHRMRYGWSRW